MSLCDYAQGKAIAARGHPFYAVIQAAMRQADTDNLEKLKAAWPDAWQDLQARYHKPGGQLPSDTPMPARVGD